MPKQKLSTPPSAAIVVNMVVACSRKVAHAQLCAILISFVTAQLLAVVASILPVAALSSVAMFVSAVTKVLPPAYGLMPAVPAPMSMARCMIGMALVVMAKVVKTAAAATAI